MVRLIARAKKRHFRGFAAVAIGAALAAASGVEARSSEEKAQRKLATARVPQAIAKAILNPIPRGELSYAHALPSQSMYDEHWRVLDEELRRNYSSRWSEAGDGSAVQIKSFSAQGTADFHYDRVRENEERNNLGRDVVRRRMHVFVQDEIDTAEPLRFLRGMQRGLESLRTQSVTLGRQSPRQRTAPPTTSGNTGATVASTREAPTSLPLARLTYGYQWNNDRVHMAVQFPVAQLQLERFGVVREAGLPIGRPRASLVSLTTPFGVGLPTGTARYHLEQERMELGLRQRLGMQWDGSLAAARSMLRPGDASAGVSVLYRF